MKKEQKSLQKKEQSKKETLQPIRRKISGHLCAQSRKYGEHDEESKSFHKKRVNELRYRIAKLSESDSVNEEI